MHAFQAKPDHYSTKEVQYFGFLNLPPVCHVSGKEKAVANALSRFNINTLDTTTSINLNKLAKVKQRMKTCSISEPVILKFSKVPLLISEGTVVCDLSTSHPCVSAKFRRAAQSISPWYQSNAAPCDSMLYRVWNEP